MQREIVDYAHLNQTAVAAIKTIPPARLRMEKLAEKPLNPARLVFGKQFRRRSAPRLILVIDIREPLPGAVLHNEAGVNILD